jgi:hypothetical protein
MQLKAAPMSFADLWSRADAVGKLLPAWARLGPLSMSCSLRKSSHRRLPATFVVAAAHPSMGWRSGFPTGRPWDFAVAIANLHDAPCMAHRAPSRSPGPCFLGSRALHCTSSAALARWVRRTADRGTLSPRGGESASRFNLPPLDTEASNDNRSNDALPLLRHMRRL